jgi:hypothetical protein
VAVLPPVSGGQGRDGPRRPSVLFRRSHGPGRAGSTALKRLDQSNERPDLGF